MTDEKPPSWKWSDWLASADRKTSVGELSTTRVRVAQKPRRSSNTRALVEWTLILTAALGIALVVRTYVLAAFYIPSPSMTPTLAVGDRVLVNKLSYRLHGIHRGDLIVFRRPPNQPDLQVHDLIKRVIGLPGDTIEFVDGEVHVNGQLLVEPYLRDDIQTVQRQAGVIVVGERQVLVLGDNRANSHDGRVFGPVDQSLIVGRAFVTVWPFSRLGSL